MTKPIQIFITKYALTQGILMAEAISFDMNGYVKVKFKGSLNEQEIAPCHWEGNKTAAGKVGAYLKKKKILSLERQITKLRAMRFT